MRSTVLTWRGAGDWAKDASALSSADVVICFGPRDKLEGETARRELAERAKSAVLIGCSTGGQFSGDELCDSDIVALAMHFDRTAIRGVSLRRQDGESDSDLGAKIGKGLHSDDLAGVFILSDGTNIKPDFGAAGCAGSEYSGYRRACG
jgi:FIST N domain